MSKFTAYNTSTHSPSSLIAQLLASNSSINVDTTSIVVNYGTGYEEDSSLSFYDGSIPSINIGAGLLLTSGDSEPNESNTSGSYGVSLTPSNTDSDLAQAVEAAFPSAGSLYDATTLQFNFTVTNGSLQSVKFDVIFASDEYPEYSDSSYVDIAGVFVNGVNYALFNGSASQPLSVLDTNLSAGNFYDNSLGTVPIEYDGISNKLSIIAPLNGGTNTIKIGVSDTGDSVYDSGIFIANLQAVNYSGNGLALVSSGTSGGDTVNGQDFNESYELDSGNDKVNAGGGDDVIDGGDGDDFAYFDGDYNDYEIASTGSGYTIEGPDGSDVLIDMEYIKFDDDLYTIATGVGDDAFDIAALFQSATNTLPDTNILSQWLAAAADVDDMSDLAQDIIDAYAPGITNQTVVTLLYQNIVGSMPSASEIQTFASMIGPGKTFETQGDIWLWASLLELNTNEFASLIGQPIMLNSSYFSGI